MPRLLVLLLVLLAMPASAAELRLAVAEFTSAAGGSEYDALGKGLQSMVTTDLAQVGALTVVERERLVELRAEIDLGSSGAVDPGTAARFGKLAGATHLVAGSLAVVGDRMRIDARLFAVESGTVLLAADIEGERDAFFELEKELVARLVEALELEPPPKERAALARIHTADFDAFQAFAEGVDAFDRQAFDRALAELRRATEQDVGFELARMTLDRYERLIAEVRAKADAIEVARGELERLEKRRAVSAEAEVLARLHALAGTTGEEVRRERMTALYLLAVAYGNLGTRQSKLMETRRVEDRFAMQRIADQMAQRYFVEARPLWPALPLVVGERFYQDLPALETFDADLDEAVATLWERGLDHPENRRNYLLQDFEYPGDMARLLHLDRAEEVALHDDLFRAAGELGAPDWWVENRREEHVKLYRRVLRLDASTRLLRKMSAASDNEWAVRGLASQMEENRDLQALLDLDDPLVSEWVRLAVDGSWQVGQIARLGPDEVAPRTPTGLMLLARLRQLDDDDYVLIGDLPVWAVQGEHWLSTGPRSDPLRGDALRYHREHVKDAMDSIVIAGGVPRDRVEARFVLDEGAPGDFWPPRQAASRMTSVEELELAKGRPAVELLFGVRDVDVPLGEERALVRPMRGHAVRIEPDRVQLVRLVEAERGMWDRKARFEEEVLGEAALRRQERTEVEVVVEGQRVRVTVGGKKHRFELPEPLEAGFTGFRWIGTGYVGIEGLEVR